MKITEIAYECVRDCADRGDGQMEFTYENFIKPKDQNPYINNPDYSAPMMLVWTTLSDACSKLYALGKTNTITSEPMDIVEGGILMPRGCNPMGITNVLVYYGKNWINRGFGIDGKKVFIEGHIWPGSKAKIEYRPAMPRFRRMDVLPLNEDGSDPNPDIEQFGMTEEMVAPIEDYVIGKLTLDRDPGIAVQRINLALQAFEDLPEGNVGLSQRRVVNGW